MGAATSKPSGRALGTETSAQQPQQQPADGSTAACPLGFDKKGSTTTADEAAAAAAAAAAASPAPASSSCPVKTFLPSSGKAGGGSAATTTPASDASVSSSSSSSPSSSSCPVKQENRAKVAKYLHPHKYNVYSQRIDTANSDNGSSTKGFLDPTNNMPANPNQQPAPGQAKPLSTARVPSTIPKGGEENTWTYPSPQMFWNALSRKGKADDTDEGDMDVVVSIHNNMNELTWKKILEWEKIRSRGGVNGDGDGRDGSEPRLLRFLGRPNDTTPKALAKMMVGHPLPFDRHDWVVDRGGDERRYVIDYYYDDGAVDEEGMPELQSEGAVKSIKVDVRPALDGFRDMADRLVQMPLARLTGKSHFVPLSFRPSPTMKVREPWAKLRNTQGPPSSSTAGASTADDDVTTATTAAATSVAAGGNATTATSAAAGGNTTGSHRLTVRERDARALSRVKKKCAKPLEMLQAAEGGDDAGRAEAAALKLEYCTARYLCKKEARAYKEALSQASASGSIIGGDQAHAYWADMAVDRRLNDMRGALNSFTERQLEARRREEDEGGQDA